MLEGRGGSNMANVFDVAKYILEMHGNTTTMKLQKLCYYSQAWTLAWDDMPLFDEDFEAWANGPVCRQLYNAHRGKFNISSAMIENGDSSKLTFEQKENINIVLNDYGDKEPYWLSGLTHSEKPWIDARKGCKDGDACSNIITKESMREYYGGLLK